MSRSTEPGTVSNFREATRSTKPTPQIELSVVVPLCNERDNVVALHERIYDMLTRLNRPFEIIFIDDGSTDGTAEVCNRLTPLTLIQFRGNYGKTAAMDAGIKNARGELVISLDGDLQNDPADIPKLLAKIDEGYDVVAGWRKKRHDTLSKRITSRTANLLRKLIFHDTIHDSGCALQIYRRECFDNLDLFGEIHRFIPALLAARGYSVTEVVVNHHPRIHGVSKYDNLRRGLKSFVDMLAIGFWNKYSARPMHLFGVTGLFSVLVGSLFLLWMAVERAVFGLNIADRIWPLLGIFLILR
ncbi:MAG: glycosyltransferase family 2 protein [Candidatus Paceibacterota bacterium]